MIPSAELLTVAFYVGLNGLTLLALSMHVGRVRHATGISIGDGGEPALIRAMRGQMNFVEYVPFCLIQMLIIAMTGAPLSVLHAFGITLTIGRVLHGWHFAQDDAPGWQRAAGAGLTMLVLLLGSLGLIAHAMFRMV